MRKPYTLPRIISALVSLVAILGLFLPYLSSTEEYGKYLEGRGEDKVYESADLTAAEMKELSWFEYSKVYYQSRDEMYSGESYIGIFYAVLFAAPGILGVLTLLCAMGKKATLMGLLSILMGISLRLINWDVVDRGIMPSSGMVWGISHVLYYPCAVVLFVCAIWLFIAKRRAKKGRLQ